MELKKKNDRSDRSRDHARSRRVLRVVFEDRSKAGRLDLEATEMAMRSALPPGRLRGV